MRTRTMPKPAPDAPKHPPSYSTNRPKVHLSPRDHHPPPRLTPNPKYRERTPRRHQNPIQLRYPTHYVGPPKRFPFPKPVAYSPTRDRRLRQLTPVPSTPSPQRVTATPSPVHWCSHTERLRSPTRTPRTPSTEPESPYPRQPKRYMMPSTHRQQQRERSRTNPPPKIATRSKAPPPHPDDTGPPLSPADSDITLFYEDDLD